MKEIQGLGLFTIRLVLVLYKLIMDKDLLFSLVIIIVYFELLVHINRIKIDVYKSILYQAEQKL